MRIRGIDEFRPFWRCWINGNSTFEWGVLRLGQR